MHAYSQAGSNTWKSTCGSTVCIYIYIKQQQQYADFLTLALHRFWCSAATACMKEAVDEEEETKIFVLPHPLYAHESSRAENGECHQCDYVDNIVSIIEKLLLVYHICFLSSHMYYNCATSKTLIWNITVHNCPIKDRFMRNEKNSFV